MFSNETIRTANASAAQLRFLDQSNLAIGPSASVVLNRFVYNPDQTAREAAVQVTTGAARWVSGSSPPRAYRIRTPHAVIGVRGTEFDLLVEPRRTIVTLREGVIIVCTIGTPQSCATLDTPGQSVIVTRSSIQGPTLDGPSPTRFAEILPEPDRSRRLRHLAHDARGAGAAAGCRAGAPPDCGAGATAGATARCGAAATAGRGRAPGMGQLLRRGPSGRHRELQVGRPRWLCLGARTPSRSATFRPT